MVLFSTESVRLDEKDKKALDNYKYQGGDNGISYIYFHSPFAGWLVTLLPMTVAPNTLTLAGALCLVIPHIVSIFVLGIGYEGPVPQLFALAVGFIHFAYITLDNMDGKQARRTGTSSPLGQMFDHGWDAITFSLGISTLIRLRQMGFGLISMTFTCLAPTGYFMYNLKEYYLGEYYLPVFNPVSEGAIIELVVNIYFSCYSWEELVDPVLFGLNRGQLYWVFFLIFQAYQNIEMFFEITNSKKYDRPMIKSKFYTQFSSYPVLITLCWILALASPNNIAYNTTDGARSIIYIIIFGTALLVLHLICGHLWNREFSPYSIMPFVIALSFIIAQITAFIFIPEVIKPYEWYVNYSIAAYLFISWLNIFTAIVKQMEAHFGIKTFDIRAQLKKN